MRSLALLPLALLWAAPAVAQQAEGVPPSPFVLAQAHDPIKAMRIRIQAPALEFGPGDVIGDTSPTYIPKAGGGFYVYGSNQIAWGNCITNLTDNVGLGAAGANNSCSGAPTTNSQTVYTNTTSLTTRTVSSSFSIGITTGSITPIAPALNSDACGDWPQAAYKVGATWYMYVHTEGPCNYAAVIPTDNISQAMFTSATGAPNTWSPMAVGGVSPGTIISSQEPPEVNALTGFSDGSMIPSDDGLWMYAYAGFFCDSAVCDYKNAVFRAPIGNLGPGNWQALWQGCFCAPALNNPWDATVKQPHADLAAWYGPSTATIPNTPYKVLATDGKGHSYNLPSAETYSGVAISVSLNYTDFTHLHSPLLNYDFQNFAPRGPDDLYLYATLRSDTDGGSVLAPTHFTLSTTWVPPANDLSKRFIVQYPVTMSVMSLADQLSGQPQIGILLGLWANTSVGHTWSGFQRATTVNPNASDIVNGGLEDGWNGTANLGYLMTSCPGSFTINQCDSTGAQIANRIEECASLASDDHLLQIDTNGSTHSCPGGFTAIKRTVGWTYKVAPTFASKPLYSCLNASPAYHFASNDPTCGGQTVVGSLGYALAQ